MGAGIYEKYDSRYARVMVKHRPAGIRVLLLWRVGGGEGGRKLTGIIGLISAPTSTVILVKREIS